MRKGTTIVLALLLLLILGATALQLFFLADRSETDPRPERTTTTSTTLG
jgi:hypothetical protein